uniref:Chemokine interleukin-8-like domain-containing protein n=1 Tax=Electrophorus electricus TaxID=8005 RepID=A0A4W4GWY7_ELEEL
MRNLCALLFVLLLCSLQLVSSGPHLNPADCCYELTQMKLPLKHIVSYNRTRSDCSIKAVPFIYVTQSTHCICEPFLESVMPVQSVFSIF